MNTHEIHQSVPCSKGHVQNTTMCEKRESSFTKPIAYWILHVFLPLPVVSLFELEWNPLEWSVYTHLVGVVWVAYTTVRLFKVLGR